MTPAEVLARHGNYADEYGGDYHNCTYCDFAPWPCDAVRMAVQLQEMTERVGALEIEAESAMTLLGYVNFGVNHNRLRKGGAEAHAAWVQAHLHVVVQGVRMEPRS